MQQTSKPLSGRTVAAVYVIVPIFGVIAISGCLYTVVKFHAYPTIPSLFLKNLVTFFGYIHFCKRRISANYSPIIIILLSALRITQMNML